MYKGILPAWSDRNLTSLCHQIEAQMFLAHVRSATTGGVSMANCHPFGLDRHLFMHNGQIGGYEHVKRKVEALIPDEVYTARSGSSDSEAIFLIAAGFGLAVDPISAFSRTLLTCLDILRSSHVDQPIAPHAFLSRQVKDAGPHDGEMRCHVSGQRIGEAAADEERLAAPVAQARDDLRHLPVGYVAERLAQVLERRLEHRRHGLAVTGGAIKSP